MRATICILKDYCVILFIVSQATEPDRATSCFPPLEACIAPSGILKFNPQEETFRSDPAQILCSRSSQCMSHRELIFSHRDLIFNLSEATKGNNRLYYFGNLLNSLDQNSKGGFSFLILDFSIRQSMTLGRALSAKVGQLHLNHIRKPCAYVLCLYAHTDLYVILEILFCIEIKNLCAGCGDACL